LALDGSLRTKGVISPAVFEIADRTHIHRLGRRVAVVRPKSHSMPEVVAIMTGAMAA
jgi:fructose transport system ATP-binding protein